MVFLLFIVFLKICFRASERQICFSDSLKRWFDEDERVVFVFFFPFCFEDESKPFVF